MEVRQKHQPCGTAEEVAVMARTQEAAGKNQERGNGPAEAIADAVLLPVNVARRVLPDRGLPVYLGIGALIVADVIEWPVAVAAGLGYVVLKGWRRTPETGEGS
jgi:hypothetical protein